MQDETLSLTSFSKQRKKKREGECLPLDGIYRFSHLGQMVHLFGSQTVYGFIVKILARDKKGRGDFKSIPKGVLILAEREVEPPLVHL